MTIMKRHSSTRSRELRNAAATSFATLFPLYKNGTANANFDVTDLIAQDGDADGLCGKIEFPETAGLIDETHVDTDWDPDVKNFDGLGTADNTAVDDDDIRILQVKVLVQYKSITGNDREKQIVATIYGP